MRYSIGAGSRAPLSTIGQRPPSASDRTCAPMSLQRIEDAPHRPLAQRGVAVEGRGDSVAADDAHHQPRAGAGVAEIERLARRQDRAEPGPRIRHWPGPVRSMTAPSASQALPVLSTSSPSSSPSTFVSPQARRPNRKARCEIDLSPGGRTRPLSGRARTALSGDAARDATNERTRERFLPARATWPRVGGGPRSYHRHLTPVDRREKRIDTTGSGD